MTTKTNQRAKSTALQSSQTSSDAECNHYNYAVSICMIVKDEEANLQRCLDSFLPIILMKDDDTLKPLAELIIVDTGSSDKTVKIASKYTDNIISQEVIPWNFSTARNIGIERATGMNIMIVDADEELKGGDNIYRLMDILLNPQYKETPTMFVNVRNFYSADNNQYSDFMQPRIFANTFEPLYSGAIHNKPRTDTPYHMAENVIFNHYGYNFVGRPELKKKKSTDRTLKMLIEEYNENPTDMHILTHLVKTYHVNEDVDQVIEYGEKWCRLFEDVDYHDGWFAYLDVFVHVIASYLSVGDLRSAQRIRKQLDQYTIRIPNIYFLFGSHYVSLGRNDDACDSFERGIEVMDTKGSQYEKLMTTNVKMLLPSIYSWLAVYFFGLSEYVKAGQYLNKGIKSDVAHSVPRWDIWNEATTKRRLKRV